MANIDFSEIKGVAIPDGDVVKIEINGTLVWKAGPTNWVPLSINADGSAYNNGLGYTDNTRLNSSAAEVTLSGYVVCGYIPVKPGDTVRVKGITWDSATQTGSYFWTFDSSFTKQKQQRPNGGSSDITVSNSNGVVSFKLAASMTDCAYFRISSYGSGADLIITVNEEIT